MMDEPLSGSNLRRRSDRMAWQSLADNAKEQTTLIAEIRQDLDRLIVELNQLKENDAIQYLIKYPGSAAEDLRDSRTTNEMIRSTLKMIKIFILIGSLMGVCATGFSFYAWFQSGQQESAEVVPQKFD